MSNNTFFHSKLLFLYQPKQPNKRATCRFDNKFNLTIDYFYSDVIVSESVYTSNGQAYSNNQQIYSNDAPQPYYFNPENQGKYFDAI